MAADFGGFLADTVSNIGHAIGAPVIFDWNTAAARNDVAANNGVRGVNSQAYAAVNGNQATGTLANGDIINYAGDVIGHAGGGSSAAAPATDGGVASGGSYGYGSSGYGYGTGSAYNPAMENAYNASFDTQTQGLKDQMNLAQQIANSGQDRVNNSFNVQRGGLDQQYGAGNANLDLSQNKLDVSKANSLRDLGQQMRLANQSYANQLGVAGAGDSSAANVLNYALSQQANQQHGDIMNNVDQQQTGINLQRSQLGAGYEQNKKMLDDWHASQIQNIVNQYASQMGSLQQALDQAQGQKAIDLAYIGKGQASNTAIQQMQALQGQYQSQLGSLQQAYSGIQAPTAQLGNDLTQQYNVNPIDAGTINQQNLSNNQVSSPGTDYSANVGVKKSTDQSNPYQYNI